MQLYLASFYRHCFAERASFNSNSFVHFLAYFMNRSKSLTKVYDTLFQKEQEKENSQRSYFRHIKMFFSLGYRKRTWGDREELWGRWLWYVMDTKVIFSFRKSVFRDVRTDYNVDLRFLVKSQISMIVADLSWGHINIFRGDTRGLCFSWYPRGLCSQGMQRTNKS